MATNYQLFRVGKVWHYRFQINLARTQRSTRETIKHRAEAVAERAFRQARMWSRGDEPVPTLCELVEELHHADPDASPHRVTTHPKAIMEQ